MCVCVCVCVGWGSIGGVGGSLKGQRVLRGVMARECVTEGGQAFKKRDHTSHNEIVSSK